MLFMINMVYSLLCQEREALKPKEETKEKVEEAIVHDDEWGNSACIKIFLKNEANINGRIVKLSNLVQ